MNKSHVRVIGIIIRYILHVPGQRIDQRMRYCLKVSAILITDAAGGAAARADDAAVGAQLADAVLEMGIMTKEEADMLLDPALLVNPEKMAEVIARWKGEKQKQ